MSPFYIQVFMDLINAKEYYVLPILYCALVKITTNQKVPILVIQRKCHKFRNNLERVDYKLSHLHHAFSASIQPTHRSFPISTLNTQQYITNISKTHHYYYYIMLIIPNLMGGKTCMIL